MSNVHRNCASALRTIDTILFLVALASPALTQVNEATLTKHGPLKRVRVNGVELHYLESGKGALGKCDVGCLPFWFESDS